MKKTFFAMLAAMLLCACQSTSYLLVYHSDSDHGLHMALSDDGYQFTSLRDGQAIFGGDTIAEQRGIRDPHIFRGPDATYYLAMTDLHIFAKQAGYRDTEWERPGEKYGWGNNRGLVLLKSKDLVHWTRKNLDFQKLGGEFSDVGCVWAPETTVDPATGKLMIYFTTRFGNGQNYLYYAYINEDFDSLTSYPKRLFEYPTPGINTIDGDIVYAGGKYHLHYVAHDNGAGVKHAVADHITGPYKYEAEWVDPEPNACEAPNVWRRGKKGPWVLMYDCYGIEKHNFGFAETTDFIHYKPIGRFNEGVMTTTNFSSPKHGAVVQISRAQADKLRSIWR